MREKQESARPRVLAWLLGAAIMCGAWSCDAGGVLGAPDPELIDPPRILSLRMSGADRLTAEFDRAAWLAVEHSSLSEGLSIAGVEDGAPAVHITLAGQVRPGAAYVLDALVRGAGGSSTSFLHRFYGYNPRVPRLLINEFITSASTTVPTQIEIAVLSDGTMGGVAVYEGTRGVPDKEFVFPDFEVLAGDFILLHFKPEGDPGEIDETVDKTAATARGSSPEAWDFWAPGTGNLSADNDSLTVYSAPDGTLIDAVIYTTKTHKPEDRYRGFGTRAMLDKVTEIARAGGWRISADDPRPEDCFNPRGATSRRSMCRDSASTDTDGPDDWHIVPAGEASFGRPNSDSVYTP